MNIFLKQLIVCKIKRGTGKLVPQQPMEKKMKWNDLITNPPTGNEYAIILFPCKTDCGILYNASNPHYAIKHGASQGYTHWAEIELAPDHDKWNEWQNNLTSEEITKSLENVFSILGNHDGIMDDDLLDILSDDKTTTDPEKHDEIYDTSSKEYVEWMSNVWRLNDIRNKENDLLLQEKKSPLTLDNL
jgi:hypothetical protein